MTGDRVTAVDLGEIDTLLPLAEDRTGFGRRVRCLWSLAPDLVPLNHGSFGALPRCVEAVQRRYQRKLESNPDRFFEDHVLPLADETPLRRAAARLGAFAGAPGAAIAFVENATVGIEAVLDSVALQPSQEVLVTSHGYNAVRLAVERRCRATGAKLRVVDLPIPCSEEEILGRIGEEAREAVRLAVIDHVTSPTALVFPIVAIAPLLRERGIALLIDGAHALGQVPLSLARLRPDWYVSNAHKWLYAPRGTAILHASGEAAALTEPRVTSHFAGVGFPRAFDYVGTRDYSAWLAAPAGMEFRRALAERGLAAHVEMLLADCTKRLAAIGAVPVARSPSSAWMRSFILPQCRPATAGDAAALRTGLWQRHRIQVAASMVSEKLLLRVSGQAYVDLQDIEQLCGTLSREGWPGRS
ncbi:aminotransferase class V-fold PLP-dependent enzyme [Sphingosinicella rhizophila]|uniref:Aminotransferase class V-fold PLP-dependent enzyme n=1 Tax=Sphingosinicella rhizophila TaxID=3050082 RepID=A0ABU3QBR7_9SPHN|nr:aminotransferase class V-fold PLP-dependent enzyme [Sphingosinicella sp. GR2756]MDT9600847.1 aminotransferase class V-fold PLP-dependent enzyme [Sphingosinicella sp. GR2756]